MRRTRHVVLPVRSWQYIGLLIVSLACLTLGLVSRDREGHAGSLAGPELAHQAPHEVDICPNLDAVTGTPSCPIAEPEEATTSAGDLSKTETSASSSPAPRRSAFSRRSLSLDLSRIISREIGERSVSRNSRVVDGSSRTRGRVYDDEASRQSRESRFRAIAIERRLTGFRLDNRRPRISTERREPSEITKSRRQNGDRAGQPRDSQYSLNLQRRTVVSVDRDRRSLSTGRRIAGELDRRESREVSRRERREHEDRVDRRSERREHRSLRSVERERAERSSRREDRGDLWDRSTRIARGHADRNNNLDRRNRERSIEARRVAFPNRVANQMRRSSVAIRDSRGDLDGSNARHLARLSRSVEQLSTNGRETLGRRVRSVESSLERAGDRRSSARSLVGSAERREINHSQRLRRDETRFHDRRSLDRATSRFLDAANHQRALDHSRRIVNQRDSRENKARSVQTRSRYDLDEMASRERRGGLVRSARSVDSVDSRLDRVREYARIRNSRDHERRLRDPTMTRSRDSSLQRRERTNRSHLSREEGRIVREKPRETARPAKPASERISPERRFSGERRAIADSARLESRRLSERRIDDGSRSREGSRMADRRLASSESSPELRVSRERIREKRSLHSQRSGERRIDVDSSRSRDRSRIADGRLDRRSQEMQVSRGRISQRRGLEYPESRGRVSSVQNRARMDRETRNPMQKTVENRVNSGEGFPENRILRSSSARRLDTRRDTRVGNRRQHVVARSIETPDKWQKSANSRLVEESSRLSVSHRRAVVGLSRIPASEIRTRPKSPADGTFARITDDSRSRSAKWERNLRETGTDSRNVGLWTKTVADSLKDYGFLKYPMNYDYVKQAFLVALCTVYGLSLYNGKRSYISNNIAQRVQRFMIW